MIRASYFVYKPNQEANIILSQLGFAARKLWDVANYEKRNCTKETNTPFPDWYDQKKRLKEHFWYKNLPSQTAQEVLKILQEAWESFFELKKSGGIENPKPPRFKQGNFNVKFLNNGFVWKTTCFGYPFQLNRKLFYVRTIKFKRSFSIFLCRIISN